MTDPRHIYQWDPDGEQPSLRMISVTLCGIKGVGPNGCYLDVNQRWNGLSKTDEDWCDECTNRYAIHELAETAL